MDEKILLAINQGWANPGLDILFAWISQDLAFSTPLLMLFLGLFSWRFGRDGIKFWLLMVLFIVLGDQLGAMFKDIAAQPRPCAELGETVRRVVTVFSINCSHNPSGMPSNHALNFFSDGIFYRCCFTVEGMGYWVCYISSFGGTVAYLSWSALPQSNFGGIDNW